MSGPRPELPTDIALRVRRAAEAGADTSAIDARLREKYGVGLDQIPFTDVESGSSSQDGKRFNYGALNALAQGMSLGWSDELRAREMELRGEGSYDESLRRIRQGKAEFAGKHPWVNGLSEFTGAVLGTVAGGRLIPALASPVAGGAAVGGAYGAGTAEEGERMEGAATGALIGAALPVAAKAAPVVKGIVKGAGGAMLRNEHSIVGGAVRGGMRALRDLLKRGAPEARAAATEAVTPVATEAVEQAAPVVQEVAQEAAPVVAKARLSPADRAARTAWLKGMTERQLETATQKAIATGDESMQRSIMRELKRRMSNTVKQPVAQPADEQDIEALLRALRDLLKRGAPEARAAATEAVTPVATEAVEQAAPVVQEVAQEAAPVVKATLSAADRTARTAWLKGMTESELEVAVQKAIATGDESMQRSIMRELKRRVRTTKRPTPQPADEQDLEALLRASLTE